MNGDEIDEPPSLTACIYHPDNEAMALFATGYQLPIAAIEILIGRLYAFQAFHVSK